MSSKVIEPADAMRQAGYAESTSKQTGRIIKSETFKEVLNRIGFTDEKLAKGYSELASASTLREYVFPAKRVEELIEIGDDSPDWDEEGREKQFKTEHRWVHVTKKEIEKVIAKMPGCELVHTIVHHDRTVAYYTAPEHAPRAKAMELASKAKGSFSPEQVNVNITDETLTEEDRKALESVKNLN